MQKNAYIKELIEINQLLVDCIMSAIKLKYTHSDDCEKAVMFLESHLENYSEEGWIPDMNALGIYVDQCVKGRKEAAERAKKLVQS